MTIRIRAAVCRARSAEGHHATFEAALAAAREIKAHAPHCRVIFTVYEMKRLGRDAAELTALADHLTAHGLVLEMLARPLPGMYDPSGLGRLLFAFFAAMAVGLIRFDGHPRSGVQPREDVDHGEHGEEEASPSSLVHAGVQGGDRRAVSTR
ncbi:recombinase family protein [Streptomyces sp. JV176]|uniref:hypothetical protein n=1 Tax=Streptomyces sp. JV176 TaxID=858630 RepID=UPI002E7E9701|nr:recombinase family protein [Streptomyces sp. JV176]